jgi:hypothetical protein
MTDKHPITPPPELVAQWMKQFYGQAIAPGEACLRVATKAAQWGADAELKACCALMDDWGLDEADLRAARRPKPPSLKEQALAVLDDCADRLDGAHENTIRRALEQLND